VGRRKGLLDKEKSNIKVVQKHQDMRHKFYEKLQGVDEETD